MILDSFKAITHGLAAISNYLGLGNVHNDDPTGHLQPSTQPSTQPSLQPSSQQPPIQPPPIQQHCQANTSPQGTYMYTNAPFQNATSPMSAPGDLSTNNSVLQGVTQQHGQPISHCSVPSHTFPSGYMSTPQSGYMSGLIPNNIMPPLLIRVCRVCLLLHLL